MSVDAVRSMPDDVDSFVDAVRSYVFDPLDLTKMEEELGAKFGKVTGYRTRDHSGVELYATINNLIVNVSLTACAH